MPHAGSIAHEEDTATSTWISVDERDARARDRAVNLLDKKLGIDIRDLPSGASHQAIKDKVLGALEDAGFHTQETRSGVAIVAWRPEDCPVCKLN